MKKLLLLLITIPFFSICQTEYCGDRPIKPIKLENQTQKEFKKTDAFITYKEELKIWKECMSPRAVSKRDDERLAEEKKEKEENQITNDILNPCGDKPIKPKRPKGLSIDEHRKTPEHIEYRKKLKAWKICLGPTGNIIRDQEKLNTNNEIVNPCGDKPTKPFREEGLNHEEYKNTNQYIEYREILKDWKDCIEKTKHPVGPCGEKPKKPFREDGLNHEEYKNTNQYIEYRKILKDWKDCIEKNK